MKTLIFFSFFSIALTTNTFCQNFEIRWRQCYGGTNEERAMDILPVGSVYFIVGWTESDDGDVSYNHGSADAWIIKTDTTGNILWEKTYGGSNGEFWRKILPAPGNCYYLLGASGSSDGDISNDPYPGSNDIWVVKIDSVGNILWDKIIGGGMIDAIESASITSDGGVAIFGWTGSQNGDVSINYGMYDMWLVKLNSDGDIMWDKSYGTDDFDYGQAMISTSDGGFLIGGASTIGGGGNLTCEPYNLNAEAILLKLDSLGNIEWQNCYGGSGHDGIYGLIEQEEGYAFTAFTQSPDGDVTGWHGDTDIWFVTTDLWGNIITENCFGGSDGEIAHNLFKDINDGFTIIGQTLSNNGDVSGNHSISEYDNDIWIFRINSEGNLIYQKCMGGQGNEAINGIKFGVVKINDNNYVIASQSDYGPSYDVACTPHGGNGVDEDWWVFEIDLADTTGVIENPNNHESINVYPNPAKDYVMLEIPGFVGNNSNETVIKIYDLFGQEVAKKAITSANTQFDLRKLNNGIYFYKIESQGNRFTGKFIIQH